MLRHWVCVLLINGAQTLSSEKTITSETFFKSMLTSFQQVLSFVIEKSILYEFQNRVEAIKNETINQNWRNSDDFNSIIERLNY